MRPQRHANGCNLDRKNPQAMEDSKAIEHFNHRW